MRVNQKNLLIRPVNHARRENLLTNNAGVQEY